MDMHAQFHPRGRMFFSLFAAFLFLFFGAVFVFADELSFFSTVFNQGPACGQDVGSEYANISARDQSFGTVSVQSSMSDTLVERQYYFTYDTINGTYGYGLGGDCAVIYDSPSLYGSVKIYADNSLQTPGIGYLQTVYEIATTGQTNTACYSSCGEYCDTYITCTNGASSVCTIDSVSCNATPPSCGYATQFMQQNENRICVVADYASFDSVAHAYGQIYQYGWAGFNPIPYVPFLTNNIDLIHSWFSAGAHVPDINVGVLAGAIGNSWGTTVGVDQYDSKAAGNPVKTGLESSRQVPLYPHALVTLDGTDTSFLIEGVDQTLCAENSLTFFRTQKVMSFYPISAEGYYFSEHNWRYLYGPVSNPSLTTPNPLYADGRTENSFPDTTGAISSLETMDDRYYEIISVPPELSTYDNSLVPGYKRGGGANSNGAWFVVIPGICEDSTGEPVACQQVKLSLVLPDAGGCMFDANMTVEALASCVLASNPNGTVDVQYYTQSHAPKPFIWPAGPYVSGTDLAALYGSLVDWVNGVPVNIVPACTVEFTKPPVGAVCPSGLFLNGACYSATTCTVNGVADAAAKTIDWTVTLNRPASGLVTYNLDGRGDLSESITSNSETTTLTHEYDQLGLYYMKAYVHDSLGSASCHAVVTLQSPFSINVSGTPLYPAIGQPVSWSATASGGTGTFTYEDWSGTDGLMDSGNNITKTYSTPGEKFASVIVSDGSSTILSPSARVIVYDPEHPTCKLTANPSSVTVGQDLAFDVEWALDSSGNQTITQGTINPEDLNLQWNNFSSDFNYSYNNSGAYNVQLFIVDGADKNGFCETQVIVSPGSESAPLTCSVGSCFTACAVGQSQVGVCSGGVCCVDTSVATANECASVTIKSDQTQYNVSPPENINLDLSIVRTSDTVDPVNYSISYNKIRGASNTLVSGAVAVFANPTDLSTTANHVLSSSALEPGVYSFVATTLPACNGNTSASATHIVISQKSGQSQVPEMPGIFALLVSLIVIGLISRRK